LLATGLESFDFGALAPSDLASLEPEPASVEPDFSADPPESDFDFSAAAAAFSRWRLRVP
jgi:hypothetical protein